MRTLPGVGDLDDLAAPLPLFTRGSGEETALVTPRTATATLHPLVLARSVGGDPRRPVSLFDANARAAAPPPSGLFARLGAFFAELWRALEAPIF